MHCSPLQAITYINDENVTNFNFTLKTTKTSILCGSLVLKCYILDPLPSSEKQR